MTELEYAVALLRELRVMMTRELPAPWRACAIMVAHDVEILATHASYHEPLPELVLRELIERLVALIARLESDAGE